MNEVPIWWYLARSTGLVAWMSMGLSVIVGIVLSTRLFPDRRRPVWLLDAHRWISGIGVVSLMVHLAALVADSYLEFTLQDLLVPFASDWRPAAVAAGVVSTWLLVITSLAAVLRRRMSRGVWTALHRLGYLSFWFATLHGAWAGTDAAHPAVRVVGLGIIGLITWGLLYRILVTGRPQKSGRPRDRAGGAAPKRSVARAASRVPETAG